jgi:hypothetical protein
VEETIVCHIPVTLFIIYILIEGKAKHMPTIFFVPLRFRRALFSTFFGINCKPAEIEPKKYVTVLLHTLTPSVILCCKYGLGNACNVHVTLVSICYTFLLKPHFYESEKENLATFCLAKLWASDPWFGKGAKIGRYTRMKGG